MRRSALALAAALTVTALTALAVPRSTSAGWVSSAGWGYSDCEGYYRRCRGFVIPCSLDGVNPVHHPSIFGNPAVARAEYGFIRSPDGTWHVEKNCVRGPYHGG